MILKKIIISVFAITTTINTLADDLMRTKPYLQNPVGGMTVMWETNGPAYSWVEFGTDTLNLTIARTLVDGQAEFTKTIHKIRLDSLRHATDYYYRVCSQQIPVYQGYYKELGPVVKSGFYRFHMPDSNATSFKAIIFNDLHQHEKTFARLCEVIANEDYDMVVFNGDVVDDPDSHDQATYFISQLTEGVGGASVPVFFMRGNHEIRNRYSVGLRDHYDYPGGKCYGAFNWGNTRFVLLDCGEDKPDDHPVYYGLNDFTALRAEQAEFLRKELSSVDFRNADKRILIHHIPMYGNYEKNLCEDLWKPILDNAPFDLSVNAHTHKYAFHPKGAVGNNYPVVIGGGYKEDSATVMVIEKKPGTLNLRVLDCNGKTLLDQTF